MKFYFVSCFVFGLLLFVCYGHKRKEIQTSKRIKHISTKIYRPTKGMYKKYLSMNPPRFPPTYIHTRLRVPYEGKINKVKWKPPTFIVRTNTISNTNNKRKWRTPKFHPTTRGYNHGKGIPGRNPVVRKIIPKRKKLFPGTRPGLRQTLPPIIIPTVRKIDNFQIGTVPVYTTTFKPPRPKSIHLFTPVDMFISPKPPKITQGPPYFVANVDYPTSKPPTFVPVPVLNEVMEQTTKPSLKVTNRRPASVMKITTMRPRPGIRIINHHPKPVLKKTNIPPRIVRTTIRPPPRIFTDRPTITNRHFSPIIFVRPKPKPKPTTPPPSIPFQQRTSAPPSIPIQQRIQPPPPIPIHQTTLPPIIVPPVLPALFEEAPMPPRLIKNDIQRIPIIKSTQKTPGNIGTSSTKTEKATAYPVNTGTSSKNGIQTTVSPLVTTLKPLIRSTGPNEFATKAKGRTTFKATIPSTIKTYHTPSTSMRTTAVPMVTTTMKQPVYSKTTTKEVTQGSTTSIIPQTRVIELKKSIKPTTLADQTTKLATTTTPTDSVKTETMLETRQQVKNGTTTNEQPRTTTTSGPTIDDILIDFLLELDKTTLIRPIVESSYDIATTSTSAAPKSLHSTTTTSTMPIVVPQKRIPNTEASITSTRDMSKIPKTTTVRPKQRSTVETIPSSVSTTTLPQTSTTIKPVSIFRYLVEKRTRPATNQFSYSPPIYSKTTTTKSTTRNEGPRDDNIPTTTEQVKMKHSLTIMGIPLYLDMVADELNPTTQETKTIKGIFVHIPETTTEPYLHTETIGVINEEDDRSSTISTKSTFDTSHTTTAPFSTSEDTATLPVISEPTTEVTPSTSPETSTMISTQSTEYSTITASSTEMNESITTITTTSTPMPESLSITTITTTSTPIPESSATITTTSTPMPESSTTITTTSTARPESSTTITTTSTPMPEDSTITTNNCLFTFDLTIYYSYIF
jgi:hypothetical protein